MRVQHGLLKGAGDTQHRHSQNVRGTLRVQQGKGDCGGSVVL